MYPATGDVCLVYELNTLRNMLRKVLANVGEGQAFEFVAPTLLRLLIEEFPIASVRSRCCLLLQLAIGATWISSGS